MIDYHLKINLKKWFIKFKRIIYNLILLLLQNNLLFRIISLHNLVILKTFRTKTNINYIFLKC